MANGNDRIFFGGGFAFRLYVTRGEKSNSRYDTLAAKKSTDITLFNLKANRKVSA